MKRIAIFSGSFNPIHIGHTALANYICEYEKVDEVWFVVSPQNPLKKKNDLAEDFHRVEMVKRAIAGYDRFHYNDVEMHLPRPSYTITTLETLKAQYSDCHFVLIIGADNWDLFDRWKESERILNDFGLIVYPRQGYGLTLSKENVPSNVCISEAPELKISSTFIREALANKKDIRYFLSEKVYEYIQENHLYQE